MHVGVDIGGTKLLGVAFDGGAVVVEDKVPVPGSAAGLVDTIVAHAQALARQAGAPAASLGIGCAGLVDARGVVHESPHLPWLAGFALASAVAAASGVPVVVDNDANAAAWGERCLGAGRNASDVVMVTLGTGIGGGIIANGALVRGRHGFAGEIGHMVVDRNGPAHVTGLRGPWELYGSGNALGALARLAAQRGLLPAGVEIAGSADRVRGEHVAVLVAAGDAGALAVLDAYAREVALGIANVVCILDPQVVVIGGGVVEMGAPLFDALERHLGELVLGRPARRDLHVVPAQLGERAGAIGAALLGAALVGG